MSSEKRSPSEQRNLDEQLEAARLRAWQDFVDAQRDRRIQRSQKFRDKNKYNRRDRWKEDE